MWNVWIQMNGMKLKGWHYEMFDKLLIFIHPEYAAKIYQIMKL